jgi:predicted DNA-binding transcriptional regulator YafY
MEWNGDPMNRVERLAAIILLLQERAYTSQQIAQHFEVSRRTILRDVQALSEMGVPVIAQEGPGGGYSLPQHYRVEPLPLTRQEIFLLMLSLSAIEKLSDLPFRQERASLKAKLRAALPQDQLSGVDGMLRRVEVDVPLRTMRTPHLESLMQAVQQDKWVRVVYHSSRRHSTLHLLPRQIYMQEGYWYCRAYTHEREGERTYRVDRIQQLDPPEQGFVPGPITQELPYEHISHPQVIVKLTPTGVAQVESNRHLGQRILILEDGSGELVFRCPPDELDWYTRYFASLGEEVQVRAPEALRLRMRRLGEFLVEQYGKR